MKQFKAKWSFPLVLFAPLLFYLIPLFLGYTWSGLGANFPFASPYYGILHPPEGYKDRLPGHPYTLDGWAASVVNVPYNARIRNYLYGGYLPLWNPYQGLGQPFAAQGEGSPYFPLTILRALFPYSQANYVTFLGFYFATIFFYLFLRMLGLSKYSALFGGIAYILSGTFSPLIARFNLVDQLMFIPVVFWAAAKAVQKRTIYWYVVLAFVVALNMLAGHLQLAVLVVVMLIFFCVFYTKWLTPDYRQFWQNAAIIVGVIVLGAGLSAFHLLPAAEAIHLSFNKNPELLSFIPIPYGNLVAFFFPYLWGQIYQSWLPVNNDTVFWDNLFAFAGSGVLLLTVAGYSILAWKDDNHRKLFLFFSLSGILLLLRYVSFPLVAGINLLPILGRQSPKHANGLTVFFFVIAASFAVEYVRQWNLARLKWLTLAVVVGLVSTILTLIGQQDSITVIDSRSAGRHLLMAALIFVGVVWVMWRAANWSKMSIPRAQTALINLVLAELALYIPLGNSDPTVLWIRFGISILVLSGGLLLASCRYILTGGFWGLALIAYALVITWPTVGLPRQFDLDRPPKFVHWLQQNMSADYRSFGIQPEYSSIAGIQDLTAAGPLALPVFHDMIRLVSYPEILGIYEASTVFTLAGYMNFDLGHYLKAKPFFDWFGIKYLVLSQDYFNPQGRTDYNTLYTESSLRVAYQDDRVTIVESLTVQPKVFFSPSYVVQPEQEMILEQIRSNPALFTTTPVVGQVPKEIDNITLSNTATSDPPILPLTLDTYEPNRLRVTFNAPSGGLLVIKDGFFPGWQAKVDGNSKEVLRVNGIVRGVLIEHSGPHTVELFYRPNSFITGCWLAIGISMLFIIGILYQRITHKVNIPLWLVVPGMLLAILSIWIGLQIYF